MKNQNTINIEFTQAEQELMNEIGLRRGVETIDGIKMTGKEAALYKVALGAAIVGDWEYVKIAKSALAKLSSIKSTKVGRNTPCPCGSGKKSKKCCN